MKKIIVTEEQRRIINEALGARVQIPSHLFSDVKGSNTPFNGNPCFPNDGIILDVLGKRFNEVKEVFSDDIASYDNKEVMTKLNKLYAQCLRKEENLRDQLEKICMNSVIELFDIPQDGVEFECELVPEISSRTEFHIEPDTDENFEYENYAAIEAEDSDTNKRIITDALVVGGAVRLAEVALKNSLSKIFELDEELPHLYSKIMKINDYLIFAQPFKIEDNSHKQGGYVKVILGNDVTPPKIEAHAVIAPILIIEILRGCLELWASHGLPDDISRAEAAINKADAVVNDPWYSRLGPVLWDYVSDAVSGDTKVLPTFIMNLCSLSDNEFNNLLREVFARTRLGKEELSKLAEKSKYEDDYSSFEYDIRQKQSERGIIEDGYFTEEELNEQG